MSVTFTDLFCGAGGSSIGGEFAGGESGPGHRPMRAEWVQKLRDCCVDEGVAFFLKQWGGSRPGGEALLEGREWREMPRVQR